VAGWCERCGSDVPVQGAPCRWCFDGRADADLVRELLADFDLGIGEGSPEYRQAAYAAVEVLGLITDPRAVPALRAAVDHGDPHVRATAIRTLSRLGDGRDVALIAPALLDQHLVVPGAATDAIVRLAGDAAADVLVASLADLNEGDPGFGPVLTALARLGDQRALEPARRAVFAALDSGSVMHEFMKPFVAVAPPDERAELRRRVVALVRSVKDAARMSADWLIGTQTAIAAISALDEWHPEEAAELRSELGDYPPPAADATCPAARTSQAARTDQTRPLDPEARPLRAP
jgi:HEAT repeat protein